MGEIIGNQTVITPVNQVPQGFQTSSVTDNTQQSEASQSYGADNSKSGKRIVLILVGMLVIFVLIIVGLFVILTPTVKGLSVCMVENSIAMDALVQRGLEEKWTYQQKCQEFKPETEKLITCYKNIGRTSVLPAQFAFSLAGLLSGKKINVDTVGLIKLHNTNCSQFPDTLITN